MAGLTCVTRQDANFTGILLAGVAGRVGVSECARTFCTNTAGTVLYAVALPRWFSRDIIAAIEV
jgi:hypothetical protein